MNTTQTVTLFIVIGIFAKVSGGDGVTALVVAIAVTILVALLDNFFISKRQ